MRRDVMDLQAALWAGLISGIVFLLALMAGYSWVTGTPPWIVNQFIAAIVLGSDALSMVNTFNLPVFLLSFVVHLIYSLILALLITFVIHRWGILVGIFGGALMGAAIYLIGFYLLAFAFTWLYAAQGWSMLLAHMLFGALAGSIYEALERDTEDYRITGAVQPE